MERLMESLGDQNGASSSEVRLGSDQRSSSKICRDSDPFDDGGQYNEGLWISHWELVCASRDRRSTRGSETGLKVDDVPLFIMGDVFEIRIELWSEVRSYEFFL